MNQEQTYLKGGTFDPDAMIDLLKKETQKALEEGYTALRVTGEMSWALGYLDGLEDDELTTEVRILGALTW